MCTTTGVYLEQSAASARAKTRLNFKLTIYCTCTQSITIATHQCNNNRIIVYPLGRKYGFLFLNRYSFEFEEACTVQCTAS
jgi:hypothetical protein